MLLYTDKLALHVSRPVRWDSDHVVVLDDELREIALEIVRNHALEKVAIGLDFFDASINRVAAWTIGTRNMIKASLTYKRFTGSLTVSVKETGIAYGILIIC